jgi:Na+:H+ antiporter, NhaA family
LPLAVAVLATVVLRIRNRVYGRMAEEEQRDTDRDGIPDVYQHDDAAADRPTE